MYAIHACDCMLMTDHLMLLSQARNICIYVCMYV